MTNAHDTFEAITAAQMAQITGAGLGSSIAGLFGPEGAKWGPIADQVLGMIPGIGTVANVAGAATSASSASSGGSASSAGAPSTGGGGLSGLGSLFSLFGGAFK